MLNICMEKKYNYFYKITNLLNSHFYYGIHSTDNLNDGYMGSGHRLILAYKKYGIENFKKDILYFFDTRKKAAIFESEMVSDALIEDNNCYNIIRGGEKFNTQGYTACIDSIDKKSKLVKVENYKNDKKRYKSKTQGVVVKEVNSENWKRIDTDEFIKNRNKYLCQTEGRIPIKDKAGRIFYVDRTDDRLKDERYSTVFSGRTHTEETKLKIKNAKIGTGVGQENSNYGKKWLCKKEGDKYISITVKKEDVERYLQNGWRLGRKINKQYYYKNALINNIDLFEMKNDYKKGVSKKEISKKYGVSVSYLNQIIKRKKFDLE